MKELCIDVRMALSSGIGTYIRNLVSKLKEGPFKLRLIADPLVLEKWPLLSKFDLILTKAPHYSIQEQIQLPFVIPACDLFWSPHYNIPLLPIRAKKRITTIHDVYHLAYKDTLSLPKKLYANFLIPQAVKQSDLVITVSEFSKNELRKYVRATPKRISAIPLGVDRNHFYPREDGVDIKIKYGLPKKYLLFVGNLAPHKNIQGLLQSLKYLKDSHWTVVLVGIKKKADFNLQGSNDQIRFLGSVDNDDLPLLYQEAYATILPSFYEGFGLPPLEAMSCGCPVIVSKVASLPEVCGDCAVYIDPHNPASIAKGIEEIAPLRELLKAKGLERSKIFSWDKTAERHIETIKSLYRLA